MVYGAVNWTCRMTTYDAYRLSTAVMAYNDSNWTEELDDFDAIIVEGADATDRELF